MLIKEIILYVYKTMVELVHLSIIQMELMLTPPDIDHLRLISGLKPRI